MSEPSCEGEDEAAAREIRGQPRGSGRGSRLASVERGDGTSRNVCPKTGGIEPSSSEGGQGRRVVDTGAPCTYCGEDLDYSVGDPGDGQAFVPVTCPHGEYLHARCMWDRAESLKNGRVDPHPYVTCRSEWPARSRPPHPAELAQGLPRPQPGRRWPAVESTLQFVELLEEGVHRLDSASHVTTGSHNTFELMVRAHGRDPTPSFLLCSLFSDALGLPSAAYLDLPRPREWESAVSRYCTLFTAFEIRSQDVLLRLTHRRLYVGPHVQKYLVGLSSERGEHQVDPRGPECLGYRCRTATFSGSGAGANCWRSFVIEERPAGNGTDGARRCCWWSRGELPERWRQGCHASGTLGNSPDTVQRRPSNT